MEALIITVPLGQGHNAVAQALAHYLAKKDVHCQIVDMYEYLSPFLKEIVSKGYFYSMKSAAKLKTVASNIYDLNDKRDVAGTFSPAHFRNRLMASEFRQLITLQKPDLIICTQVYAAQVINILQEAGELEALTVGIITDFTIQNYWQDVEAFDYIVTPSDRLGYQLVQREIAQDRVLPFGIPVAEKFAQKTEQKEARIRLDLPLDLPLVLVMGGGMGFGDIDDYIDELDNTDLLMQLVVVCGSNEHLYHKLTHKVINHEHQILGYVDTIDLLMDAADCIITKPGGISTAESLAKGLPMIMVGQLPGVEDRNVEFLLNNGAALYATKTFPLGEALQLLLETPERLQQIKTAMASLAKPHATARLCDFLIEEITTNR